MNILGIHFCMDEARMIMLAIPFVGVGIMGIQHFWHRIWHDGKPKDDGCCEGHEHDAE